MTAGDDWSEVGRVSRDVFTPDARELLYFVYRFWAANRRPPNLQDVHDELGFGYRHVRRLYRQLEEGFAVVVQDDRIQLGLLKAPPFSATPTPVRCFLDGEFLSYLGCPAEAFTVGGLPVFDGIALEVRSYCGCCYTPITMTIRGQEILAATPEDPRVAILSSPFEWEHGVSADRVCDVLHFVLDADHAERFGALHGRRQVVVEPIHLIATGKPLADKRMRDPDWPPFRLDGHATVEAFTALGADVAQWRWPPTEHPS